MKKIVFLLVFFLSFSSSAFASVNYPSYFGTDNSAGVVMWSDQLYKDDIISTLRIDGSGAGKVTSVNATGEKLKEHPVTVNGPMTVEINAQGFRFEATSGKFWAVEFFDNNSLNDFHVVFPAPPVEGGGPCSVKVTSKEFISAKDVYRITYSGWPVGTASYQLHFVSPGGKPFTGDRHTFKPTGIHYLTCNGTYWLRFYDAAGNEIASTCPIQTSEIKNPACSSYPDAAGEKESPTKPGGAGAGEAPVPPDGTKPGDCACGETPLGKCLGEIKKSLSDIKNSVDEVKKSVDGVKKSLDDNLPAIKDNTKGILDHLTPSSPYPSPGFPDAPDFKHLLEEQKPKDLNQPFVDTNVYFKDQGHVESPPPFPPAPEPVDNWDGIFKQKDNVREEELKQDTPLKQDPNLKEDPPLKMDEPMKTEKMEQDAPLQMDKPMQRDEMKQDAPLQRDEPMQTEKMQQDAPLQMDKPLQQAPPLQMQQNDYPLRWKH